jgi:hypothetical protein
MTSSREWVQKDKESTDANLAKKRVDKLVQLISGILLDKIP